jgi:hypothetical protein
VRALATYLLVQSADCSARTSYRAATSKWRFFAGATGRSLKCLFSNTIENPPVTICALAVRVRVAVEWHRCQVPSTAIGQTLTSDLRSVIVYRILLLSVESDECAFLKFCGSTCTAPILIRRFVGGQPHTTHTHTHKHMLPIYTANTLVTVKE